jgi:hypothetical protein
MSHMRKTIAALALTLASLGACAGSQKTKSDLDEQVRNYNEGVRWERFSAAAASLPPPQRASFVDEMDQRAQDLKITDYEIVKVDPRGPREARVQVKMSWYKESEGTVRETHSIQTWERRGKDWLLVDQTRLRGAEMPGLVESADAKPDLAPPHG